jgi:transcription elongation GreA/GreB family factor
VSTNLARAEAFRPAYDGEAEVGERVTVIDLTTGGVRDYRLVAPDAGQTAEDEVPISTALGAALLGRHVGDVVTTVGDGRASWLEIVEIDG